MVRPATFVERRIPKLTDLFGVVEQASVHLRGWDFPFAERSASGVRLPSGVDWVGCEIDWNHYLESWRLYQSGQFVDVAGYHHDWRDQSNMWPGAYDPSNSLLGVGDIVNSFIEIFEFAARFAFGSAGDDFIHVEIILYGLRNRLLVLDDPSRMPFFREYRCNIDEYPQSFDMSRIELKANTTALAEKALLDLFQHFNWDAPLEIIRNYHQQLRR